MFMRRTEADITGTLHRFAVLSWDVLVRRNIFQWAGWVARLSHYDPQRLTFKILNHKNWRWIQSVAIANGGRQLHGRILKVWRWEALVYRFFVENLPGVDWQSAAQDANQWRDLISVLH